MFGFICESRQVNLWRSVAAIHISFPRSSSTSHFSLFMVHTLDAVAFVFQLSDLYSSLFVFFRSQWLIDLILLSVVPSFNRCTYFFCQCADLASGFYKVNVVVSI